jgi:hypothetical protein
VAHRDHRFRCVCVDPHVPLPICASGPVLLILLILLILLFLQRKYSGQPREHLRPHLQIHENYRLGLPRQRFVFLTATRGGLCRKVIHSISSSRSRPFSSSAHFQWLANNTRMRPF